MQDINLKITVDSSGAVSSVNNVGVALEKFTSRAQRADGKLREFEKGLGSFRRAILGVQSAILGFGLMDLVRDLVRVNSEFERVRFSLLAGHDSMDAANHDFAWLRKEAVRLGTPLNKIGLEFAKLTANTKGTALQGQATRDIFTGVGTAAIAMGLDVSTTQRVFMALSQMLSKGKVQAEEARQQFGEHLPGGFKALARAAGFDAVTGLGKFQAALKAGTVDSIKMMLNLPGVLQEMFGPAAEAAMIASPMQHINSFKAAMADLAFDLGKNGGFIQHFVGMLGDIGKVLQSSEGQKETERLANSLGFLMETTRSVVKIIAANIRSVTAAFSGLTAASIVIGLRGLVGWMGKLAGATSLTAALTNPWILLAVAIGAAVTGLMMFSDTLVKSGKATARVIDWVITGFQQIGLEIWRAAIKLQEMIPPGLVDQTLAFLNAVKLAFMNTFKSIVINVTAAFNTVKTTIKPVIDWIAHALGDISFEDFAKVALLVISNTFLGIVNAVGPTIRMIADLFRIGMEALAPAVQPIADLLSETFDIIIDIGRALAGMSPDTSAWEVLQRAVLVTLDVLSIVVSSVMAATSFIANLVGPIVEVISSVVRGLHDAVSSIIRAVVGLFTDANANMSQTSKNTTESTGLDWIKTGDIIVGSILTVLRIMGMMARALLSFGALAIEVGGRVGEVFLALGQAILGVLTWDMDKIKDAGSEIAQAITRPLVTDGRAAIDALVSEGRKIANGDDFHTVSGAVGTYNQTRSTLSAFGDRVSSGFGQTGAASFRTGQPVLDAAAEDAGKSAGNAYLRGLMNEWRIAAADRTFNDAAKRAALKTAQDELAARQAAAWQAENAAVDRTIRPDAVPSAGHSGSRRTPAQKAQDMIDDLLASQATDNALSIQIELHPYLDNNAIKAVESAQDALRKAGYEFSYAEAQAQGGMPKLLADTAYSASLANQQLQEYKKMQEEIGKNMQAIDSMQEQVTLARDLTISSNELSDTLAAQQQLRSSGSRLTVAEALALNELGKAINPVQYALVQSTKAQAAWNREATAAAAIAKDLRGFRQTRDDMLALASAQVAGESAMLKATATITAQHAVMEKFGDDVFDSSRLLDTNTKALYDNIYALALMGGSANAVAAAIKNINDAYLQMTDPMAAARQKAEDSATGQRMLLDSFMTEATAKRDQTINDAFGGDPAAIDSTIQKALADFQLAKEAYDRAVAQLGALTTEEIRANSNDFADAAHTAWVKFSKDAQNVGSQIQETFSNAFSGMTDALTNFVMTGKLDFASLALSVIQDITRMIIKWLIWMAIKTAANAVGIPLFADGGVMSSAGPASLPQKSYANGGIANSPQLALFGEGRKPEAYVPLPDGRTIPVTMTMPQPSASALNPAQIGYAIADALMSAYTPSAPSGGYSQPTGGGMGMSAGKIEINAPITVSMPASSGGGQGNGGMDQKTLDAMSKKISGELRSVVVSVVQDEMRPGGAFNKMGSNRSRF